jgi:hypothetical protein
MDEAARNQNLQKSSQMTKTGSLNDCKICAEEIIQSTARKTGIDERMACKSQENFETGLSRQEAVLLVLRDRKKQ